jgi:glutamate-1-semialdehyde 2,1-aminomutase
MLKSYVKKFGTLLIFDEICTGFRVSLGGAQKLYNITPDLSTFGKGMANGYPLSVLVGKKKIMKYMSKNFLLRNLCWRNFILSSM